MSLPWCALCRRSTKPFGGRPWETVVLGALVAGMLLQRVGGLIKGKR